MWGSPEAPAKVLIPAFMYIEGQGWCVLLDPWPTRNGDYSTYARHAPSSGKNASLATASFRLSLGALRDTGRLFSRSPKGSGLYPWGCTPGFGSSLGSFILGFS